MTQFLESDAFREYLIEEYTKEKIKNPSASLEKFLPIAKRSFLALQEHIVTTTTPNYLEIMNLDLIVNRNKKKEK